MLEFSTRSELRASPEAVWKQIATISGVNREFFPFLRMTAPREARSMTLDQAPTGERLFRSWILLFGVIPIDYDEITLVRVNPGQGFLERSRLLSQRVWEHERSLEASAEGCILTDRIACEPRFGSTGPLWMRILPVVFRYRHWQLRRSFGGRPLLAQA